MKVIYRENGKKGQCPYLTDGKEYDVEDIVEFGEDGLFYAVIDDSKDDLWEGQPIPYPTDVFEVVEEKQAIAQI